MRSNFMCLPYFLDGNLSGSRYVFNAIYCGSITGHNKSNPMRDASKQQLPKKYHPSICLHVGDGQGDQCGGVEDP